MAITAGTRIASYEIAGKLGEGGMGEVYRARDARLNRDVAIKVLPASFATDVERVARFTREAQTLAALNHPNIAQIFGIVDLPGDAADTASGTALVMECVDGEDLSERLVRGALPLDEVLPIARQIAEALEAAHDQGIVHRDLKPANVKVRADGTVKVLDFGLAKATEFASSSSASASPTFTGHATQLGVIIGTAAYMAPEQARGKMVDRRADIWSFGLVVFEMLTGQRAFRGDEITDVLAAVLRQDIEWSALPANTPARLRRLLERCLERDPRSRLRDIGEARVEIAKIEAGAPDSSSSGVPLGLPATVGRSGLRFVWPAVAAVAVVASLVMAATLWSTRRADPVVALARMSVLPPPDSDFYPDTTAVAISPDGATLALVVGRIARSETQLWLRSLDGLAPRRLEGADGAYLPFWSPDGRRIGFFSGSKLMTIAASGGRADAICDARGGRGAAWGPSNTILFAPDAAGPLYSVSANGGTPVQVTTLDASKKEYGHRFPSFLPDGDHFTYAALPGRDGKFDIYVGSLSGKERKLLARLESAPVYADPGWLLYARQGVLMAQAFDSKALAFVGDPVALEDEPSAILDPVTSYTAARPASISTSGALAYYSAPSMNTTAEWYDTATGQKLGVLAVPSGHYERAVIAPDGVHAALVRSTSPSESAVWIADLARGSAAPLSSGPGRNDSPVWSPDGSRVVFASDRDGAMNFFVKAVGDASPEQPLYSSPAVFKSPSSWSPDGRWIVLSQIDPVTAQNIWLLPASGQDPLTPYFAGPARDNPVAVSPDGRWLTHVSDDTGRYQLYAQSFPVPGHKVQVSEGGAFFAWWAPDGRSLLYVGDDLRTIWRVGVQPGATLSVGNPVKVTQLPANMIWLDATPDRKRLLALSPERTGTGSMTVVLNWRAALEKRR